jgi:hypothetical protein
MEPNHVVTEILICIFQNSLKDGELFKGRLLGRTKVAKEFRNAEYREEKISSFMKEVEFRVQCQMGRIGKR